jgi:hypothetical protein
MVNLLHTELEVRSWNEDKVGFRYVFRAFLMFHVCDGKLVGGCVIRSCGRRDKILVPPSVCGYFCLANAVPQQCQNLIEGIMTVLRGDGCNLAASSKVIS